MKLSFIIPYYNNEATIGRCLQSLLDQDMTPEEYEIIVVDDGSTHKVDLLREFESKYTHVHYFWQSNGRQGSARNRGIKEAKGQYIHFCDADDMVQPQTVGYLCDIADKENVDILFFNQLQPKEGQCTTFPMNTFPKTDTVVTGIVYMQRHADMSFGPHHYIISRSFIEKHHFRFKEKLLLGEDLYFIVPCLIKAERVTHMDVVAYYWIQNDSSITHRYGKMQHAKEYLDDKIALVAWLDKLAHTEELSACELIKHKCDMHEMGLLANAALFLPVSATRQYIGELKVFGRYPFQLSRKPKHHRWLLWLMNKYPLWIVFVIVLHLFPREVRYRIK